MGLLALILIYLSLPFWMVGLIWLFRWVWIIISLARGDQEAIYEIKNSTCNNRSKRTWGEWFEDVVVGQPEENNPPINRDHPPINRGRPPW